MSDNNESVQRAIIPVLFEDEHLVIVHKPSGMFVHRSLADRSATEFVVQHVRDQVGYFVYPVHRLDRPTSGVLMLAKSSAAAALFGSMFAERQVQKTYVALVRGHTDDAGTINRPLVSDKGQGKSESNPLSVPQDAETAYRTLERFEVPIAFSRHATTRCSLVEVHPKTGRYHQIRRHLAGISHPVIGDADHGDTKFNRHVQTHLGTTRLMLAAVCLEFTHPALGTGMKIDCPLEQSFRSVIEKLGEGNREQGIAGPFTGESGADR